MNKSYIVCVFFLLTACSTYRYFPEKYHIIDRKIMVDDRSIDIYDLENLTRQKADRKILGVRFYTGIYLLGYTLKDKSSEKLKKIERRIERKKQKHPEKYVNQARLKQKAKSSLKSWMMNVVGEPPSFYDSLLSKRDMDNMVLYMKQKGFFDVRVYDSIKPIKKNKVQLIYTVNAGSPYIVKSIERKSEDVYMNSFLQQYLPQSLLREGMRYDEEVMDNERTLITKELRRNGFFQFNKDYIRFFIDTSSKHKTVNIELRILMPKKNEQHVQHERYKIGNIYVDLNFSFTRNDSSLRDTLLYSWKRKNGRLDSIYFIYDDKLFLKPATVSNRLFFSKGNWFNEDDAIRTIDALNGLNCFRYVNVRYLAAQDVDHSEAGTLDTYIELTPMIRNSINIEMDATNNAGNLGMAGSFVYRNKNLFARAQQFSISARGGLELQRSFFEEDTTQKIVKVLPFNSAEYNFQANLMVPLSSSLFARSARPMMRFVSGFHYQLRPSYSRYITTLSASLEYKESSYRYIQVYAPLNLVKVNPDSIFKALLMEFPKPLRYSYTDHLIPSMGLSVVFNNQDAKSRFYSYRRTNFEMAGITYWIIFGFNSAMQNEVYKLLDIAYSQYLKLDLDRRYYYRIGEKQLMAFRLFAGLGFPFGNSIILPFEKSYSASGANDIRAWKFRSLGPGIYNDTTVLDRTGDISLILSYEYRFPIWSWFKGALFADAGNVWLWRKNNEFPGGEFSASFYKQIALGTGFGLRMDFDFLVVRVDAAIPIRDPVKLPPFLPFKESIKKVNFNLGIGYPF
ncbi:MAG: BamA/TamA family outer membrane protein [Bacteroidales bacterium]|nr:BamA/TamA family outer membrane protein [Bacteroidales bacterium]